MLAQPLRSSEATMSIGSVVELLAKEFDDISLSKVRFLESAGLISPSRTASGYRRYSRSDIERLRFILTAQRDLFLPNKVIGEQLERVDAGELTLAELHQQSTMPLSAVTEHKENFSHVSQVRLTERSLCLKTGIDPEFLDALIDADLLRATGAGFYVEDDIAIVEACKTLCESGIDTRHLRSFRTAIDRIADLVRQAAGASRALQSAEVKGRTAEQARVLANSASDLAAGLLKQRLRDVLDY